MINVRSQERRSLPKAVLTQNENDHSKAVERKSKTDPMIVFEADVLSSRKAYKHTHTHTLTLTRPHANSHTHKHKNTHEHKHAQAHTSTQTHTYMLLVSKESRTSSNPLAKKMQSS